MQFLDDIWASVKGNATTRIKDPIIGTFILSWCLCNWDKLGVLFFGNTNIDNRIRNMVDSVSFMQDPILLWDDKGILISPLLITVFYLLVLPWISLQVKKKQQGVESLQHTHLIQQEVAKAETQHELNKAKLKSDPNKSYLAKDLELDLESKSNKIERRHKILGYIEQKKTAAKALSDKKSAEAEAEEIKTGQLRINFENKQKQAEREKQNFAEKTVIHEATMASHRLPVAFYFMELLSKSLKNAEIVLTFDALSACISALFGYSNFQALMNDKNFNNTNLSELKYIYLDDELVTKFEEILEAEQSENEDIDSALIFDHIYDLFDNKLYEVVSSDSFSAKISEAVNENSHELLQSNELAGPMAETNTIFDDIELDVEDSDFELELGFKVIMEGFASGSHRKESDIGGQDISIRVEALCKPVLGKYGFSGYELIEVNGQPRHYE